MSFIYKIMCIVTNKVYVGSTDDVIRRQKAHFADLRKKSHSNIYMQAAYDKYGKDSLKFEVIEECKDTEVLVREQYWITEYKSCDGKHGFNLSVAHKSNPDAMALWADAEFRKTQPVKISETMIEYCKNEDIRAQRKRISNEYWNKESSREKVSSRMLKQWSVLPEEEKRKRKVGLGPRKIVRFITLYGETKPIIEWSKLSGLRVNLLNHRLMRGISGSELFKSGRTNNPKTEFVEKYLKKIK